MRNFLASRQRQRKNVIDRASGKRQIVRSRCLNEVATTNKDIMHYHTILKPENMVMLSGQSCRVPSSGRYPSRFVCHSSKLVQAYSKKIILFSGTFSQPVGVGTAILKS